MGCLLEGFSDPPGNDVLLGRTFREPMKEPYHVYLCRIRVGCPDPGPEDEPRFVRQKKILIKVGSAWDPAGEQVMGSQREPPFGQVLGPGQAAPGELLDLPDAVAQRLLVDVQFRGGQLSRPVVLQYDPQRV